MSQRTILTWVTSTQITVWFGLREIGNNSIAKRFGGWTWRFTDNLEVANKKTNLALEKFRKSETIKEMLGLNFQPITLAHSHEKLSHSFPTNKNTKKKYPSQQVLKRKKKKKTRCFCLRTFCQLPLRHSKWETLQQRHNWTAVSLMRYTRQRMLSTLVPCVSDCEKIKTINKIDEHFVGMLQIGKMIMYHLYFSNNWFSAT